jgi:hypothetical protein
MEVLYISTEGEFLDAGQNGASYGFPGSGKKGYIRARKNGRKTGSPDAGRMGQNKISGLKPGFRRIRQLSIQG